MTQADEEEEEVSSPTPPGIPKIFVFGGAWRTLLVVLQDPGGKNKLIKHGLNIFLRESKFYGDNGKIVNR